MGKGKSIHVDIERKGLVMRQIALLGMPMKHGLSSRVSLHGICVMECLE